MNECPVCGGDGVGMGVLGNLLWYRCRNCGAMYSVDVSEVELLDAVSDEAEGEQINAD